MRLSKKIMVLMIFFITIYGISTELKVKNSDLSIEEFFNVNSIVGKSSRDLSFSFDDTYLAFRWNSFEEEGYDLYLYNIKDKTIKKVTSIEIMKKYDTPEDYKKFIEKKEQKEKEKAKEYEMNLAYKDYLDGKKVDLNKFEKEELENLKIELEKEKKKKEEEKKKQKLEDEKNKEKENKDKDKEKSDVKNDENKEKVDKEKKEKDLELWELRDKLKEKKEEDKIKKNDLYPGISNFKWSKTKNELIFTYRGDLFRYILLNNSIERLTMSDDFVKLINYTENSDGCFYSIGEKVYKMKFNSSFIFQINHKLKEKDEYNIEDTSISTDGKWMIVTGSKKPKNAKERKVELMQYDKRFATSKKIEREVTDDKRHEPSYNFYLRKIDSQNYGEEPKPFFEVKGGDVWYEFSDFEWSKQGNTFSFMTWEREKGDLKIWICKVEENAKPEVLFQMKEKIGYKHFYYNNVKFTPDGKKLLAILTNEEGFRQPVIFDLQTKEKKELIKGAFESFPILSFTEDSKFMFIISDKIDTAKYSVFKVNLKNGEMQLIGKKEGMHKTSEVSHNGKFLATNYGNWDKFNELILINIKSHEEKVLTDSHNKDFLKYKLIKPQLFTYKNRHGDTIHGMVFKPDGWNAEDKRPSLVYFYGGPLGRDHTVESGTTHRLSYMFQMFMAAKYGYVTVNIDPRGHSGYGTKFNEANFEHPGISQTEDLEDLKKFMETGFGVDTDKIGIYGWSFGGYQTQYTMYTSPDTFACGIAVAGPTEWENYNSWYSGSTIGKSERGKPTLRNYSLIPLAKNLKKPLLLIHGMMDPNVLYQDTVNVYRALLESGKEPLVDLFLDPEGTHGLGGAVKNKGTFKKFETWFVDKLGTVAEKQ